MLELINVSTGLPWFYTIIAGTVVARLLLLPFSIKQLRNSAALAPHQPRLIELKEELDKVYKTGDKLAVQRVALKQRKVYEESGVSMLPMLLMPFVQLPVTLGMFFGTRVYALSLWAPPVSASSCRGELSLSVGRHRHGCLRSNGAPTAHILAFPSAIARNS
jgi:hypothetical protein